MTCKIVFFAVLVSMSFDLYILQDVALVASNVSTKLFDCSSTEVFDYNVINMLYTPKNIDRPIYLTKNNLNTLDSSLKVKVIIHGWMEGSDRSWVAAMKDTYLQNQLVNVIAIDWSYHAIDLDYIASICAARLIGDIVGDLLNQLPEKAGIPLTDITIIGFSLGGHIAGLAGKRVQYLTQGKKIGQINGLDAAGPGFIGLPASQRLDKNDAMFVQAIHTSGGKLGYASNYGNVDFQVSCTAFTCGSIQYGCPLYPGIPTPGIIEDPATLLACNHFRAVSYFIESIYSKNFFGYPQSSCLGRRTSDKATVMGEHCPTTATGVQYLSINFKPPFAKGSGGTCNSF